MIRRVAIGIALRLLSLALLSLPRTASAHPTVGPLGVVSTDENGAPRAVRTAHGLVTLDQKGRWRFVCPRTWGGLATPLARGLGPDRGIMVIGTDGPFEMTIDAIAEPRPVAGIVASNARELEIAGDRVLALAFDPARSVIVAFTAGAATEIVEEQTWLHSIEASPDHFLVASSTAEGVRLETRTLDNIELASSIVRYADIASATVAIEQLGDELYAQFAHRTENRLAKVEGDRFRLIATSTSPLLGPVRAGDQIWFVEDGALLRVNGADVEVVDQSQPYFCLEQAEGSAYACIGNQIFALRPGSAPELIFDLADVKGPRLSHFDADGQVTCEFEWTIFAGEAGLDPAIPTDEPELPASCGCSSIHSDRIALPLLIWIACWWVTRRRAAFG